MIHRKLNNGVIEEFASLAEFKETILSRTEVSSDDFDEPVRERRLDRDWYGVRNFDEAIDYLTNGWESESFQKILKNVKRLEHEGYERAIQFEENVYGFQPIIPNVLKGVPNQMINSVRIPKKNKVIDVLVAMDVSCNITSSEVLAYLDKVITKIYQLEKSGFRINLKYLNCFVDACNRGAFRKYESFGTTNLVTIELKNARQTLNLKKLMYPFGHPAMQRVLCFDWYEHVSDGRYISGYGNSTYSLGPKALDKIKKLLNIKNSTYIITYDSDLEKLFKEVR